MEHTIGSARSGSREELGRLLDRQYLLLIANQELHADLQAKVAPSDVVQETFLDAQRDFPNFEGRSEDELLAWLRQILLNNIRDATRKYRNLSKRNLHRETSLSNRDGSAAVAVNGLPAAIESPSWSARRRERNDGLRRAIGRLSEDHRAVIVARNLELRSFVEIGVAMQRSPNAVRKLWLRALESLQRELGEFDEY